jgi:hypothetical protein
MDRNVIWHDPRHLRVPSGASKMISEPIVQLAQTDMTHVTLELSGASKMVSDPMVCLGQTMHLSCTNTNTVSKWIKMRFDMTHVTLEFHQVRPKRFKRLWCVRRKLCTYIASRKALSPNWPKWASTWASSPGSTIGYVQNDSWAYGMFGVNHAPILHRH